MLDGARPPERTIIRDLFELLDARLVREGAAGDSSSGASASPPDVGGPLSDQPPSYDAFMADLKNARPEPLFPMHKKEAA